MLDAIKGRDADMNIIHMKKEYFYEQLKGAILGFIVADAFGVPAEFMDRSELKSHPIYDMISGGFHNQPAGTWSDDTSMILCTIESLIASGVDYNDQMSRFEDWIWNATNTAHGEVFDVGGTTKRAIFEFAKKKHALDCGDKSEYASGNGSLMRILPTALYIVSQNGNYNLDDTAAEIIHIFKTFRLYFLRSRHLKNRRFFVIIIMNSVQLEASVAFKSRTFYCLFERRKVF